MKNLVTICVALLTIDYPFIGKYEAATYIGLVIFAAMLVIIFGWNRITRK